MALTCLRAGIGLNLDKTGYVLSVPKVLNNLVSSWCQFNLLLVCRIFVRQPTVHCDGQLKESELTTFLLDNKILISKFIYRVYTKFQDTSIRYEALRYASSKHVLILFMVLWVTKMFLARLGKMKAFKIGSTATPTLRLEQVFTTSLFKMSARQIRPVDYLWQTTILNRVDVPNCELHDFF